jgi:hypothetical protein
MGPTWARDACQRNRRRGTLAVGGSWLVRACQAGHARFRAEAAEVTKMTGRRWANTLLQPQAELRDRTRDGECEDNGVPETRCRATKLQSGARAREANAVPAAGTRPGMPVKGETAFHPQPGAGGPGFWFWFFSSLRQRKAHGRGISPPDSMVPTWTQARREGNACVGLLVYIPDGGGYDTDDARGQHSGAGERRVGAQRAPGRRHGAASEGVRRQLSSAGEVLVGSSAAPRGGGQIGA